MPNTLHEQFYDMARFIIEPATNLAGDQLFYAGHGSNPWQVPLSPEHLPTTVPKFGFSAIGVSWAAHKQLSKLWIKELQASTGFNPLLYVSQYHNLIQDWLYIYTHISILLYFYMISIFISSNHFSSKGAKFDRLIFLQRKSLSRDSYPWQKCELCLWTIGVPKKNGTIQWILRYSTYLHFKHDYTAEICGVESSNCFPHNTLINWIQLRRCRFRCCPLKTSKLGAQHHIDPVTANLHRAIGIGASPAEICEVAEFVPNEATKWTLEGLKLSILNFDPLRDGNTPGSWSLL